jgi:hypothetical protein
MWRLAPIKMEKDYINSIEIEKDGNKTLESDYGTATCCYIYTKGRS